jgi:5'-nucleotidase
MRILSNDDGYFAGAGVLAEALSRVVQITVVAPERDRSGASNSLTLDRPLMVRKSHLGFLYVNGTPTDCVHLAVTGLLDELPDMIVAGINHGANMGDDTIYSGTVAAAPVPLGIPAIAMPLAKQASGNYATAARGPWLWPSGRSAAPSHAAQRQRPGPALRAAGGHRVTRCRRHKAERVVQSTNPRGETVYWIGAAGGAADAGEGTDFHAVASGYVSITPLQIDLTQYGQLDPVRSWLGAQLAPAATAEAAGD